MHDSGVNELTVHDNETIIIILSVSVIKALSLYSCNSALLCIVIVTFSQVIVQAMKYNYNLF